MGGASKSVLVDGRGCWVVEAGRKLTEGLISCGVELVVRESKELSRPSKLSLRGLSAVCPGHV